MGDHNSGNEKTNDTFSGDCGGSCQGHCGQCATAARNREAIRQQNEERRRLVAEKNGFKQ